jgi:hypothetical protein
MNAKPQTTSFSIMKPLKSDLTREEERARVSKNIARKALRDAKKAVAEEPSILSPWFGMKTVPVGTVSADAITYTNHAESGTTELGYMCDDALFLSLVDVIDQTLKERLVDQFDDPFAAAGISDEDLAASDEILAAIVDVCLKPL